MSLAKLFVSSEKITKKIRTRKQLFNIKKRKTICSQKIEKSKKLSRPSAVFYLV